MRHVSPVRIHCYGCTQTVSVDERAMHGGLAGAAWALSGGETYCPRCAAERNLQAVADDAGPHEHAAEAVDLPAAPQPFAQREVQAPSARRRTFFGR
jgi:hypothetical protein